MNAPAVHPNHWKDLKPAWTPQEGSQQAFLACPFFECLYEGTRGPGKTDALIMDFLQDVGKGYGAAWRGILFRQTYKQLQDIIAKTKKWIPQIFPAATYNAGDHYWRFPDGEELLLRHFMRESDYWDYHGHEYPWIAWEELCNWADDGGYKRMMSCCRSSQKGMPRKYRATTNPYGPGHNWVKFRFRLPAYRFTPITDSVDDHGDPEPTRIAIHGHIYENKILLDADPDYINRIKAAARNEAERKAWLEGSWDIIAGGMFDDLWNPKFNVVNRFAIPDSWRVDRAFDWGSSKPFSVGWWAESDGTDYIDAEGKWRSSVRGDLFRVAEWYGWAKKPNVGLMMLAVDVSKGILEREHLWGIEKRVEAGPADSAIYNEENGVCIGNDMAQPVRLDSGLVVNGTMWTRADKRPGSRKSGWETMRMFMKNAHPVDGPREKPGLFVFDNCDQFIRTVPVLPRSEKDPDDVDTDAEDHIGDETRYRIRASGTEITETTHTGMW